MYPRLQRVHTGLRLREQRAICSLLLVPLLLTFGCAEEAPESPRPNVIVVIADDLGWSDVGYHGSRIETPNIDSLAEGGVRFAEFYVSPWCAPTRAAYLTGRFARSWAHMVAGVNEKTGTGIDAVEYTLAERFRDAGYGTALIGKWHLGTLDTAHPNRHGFDYFFGHLGGYIGYWQKSAWDAPWDWQRNGEDVHDLEYATTRIGEDAARYIRERDASRPFFLTLAFNAPHFPAHAPQEVIDKYIESTSCGAIPERCEYMAQVDIMDREIGRVVGVLDEEDIRENTLIVFFSDNGGMSIHGGLNQPYRGEKQDIYQGGVHVPALMNWPGVVPAGGESRQRMRASDLYSTLEKAAGLGVEAPPGAPPRESADLWEPIVGRSEVRRAPFLLTNFFGHSRDVFRDQFPIWTGILTDEWKLVEMELEGVTTVELFRIAEDPYEQNDVASVYPSIVEKLRRDLVSLQSRTAGESLEGTTPL